MYCLCNSLQQCPSNGVPFSSFLFFPLKNLYQIHVASVADEEKMHVNTIRNGAGAELTSAALESCRKKLRAHLFLDFPHHVQIMAHIKSQTD